jgi:hypothetical protein
MKCFKCGYERRHKDGMYVPATECPSCGVVYAKSGIGRPRDGGGAVLPLRPSPLDESTLKQARQRVELRIRQRSQSRLKDERHALTLARARQIASTTARKRQEEIEKRQHLSDTSPPQTASSTVAAEVTPVSPAATAGIDLQGVPVQSIKTAVPKGPAAPLFPGPKIIEQRSPQSIAPAHSGVVVAPTATAAIPAEAEAAPQMRRASAPTRMAGADTMAEPEESTPLQVLRDPAKENKPSRRRMLPANRKRTAARVPEHYDGPLLVKSGGIMRLLPLVAWLILLAGVVGMALSWTTLSPVEAGSHAPPQHGIAALPLGLLLGFAYLATGVLGFAFFWVSSLISNQLKDIRRLLQILHLSVYDSGGSEKAEAIE